MFFRHSVSFSGKPEKKFLDPRNLSKSSSLAEARQTSIPSQPFSLPHPRCFTRSPRPLVTVECGMWPSPPCGIPGSQGRGRAEPSRHGRLPAEAGAAGRQRAAGLAGRTAQEAPAPEVTALLSDPSHIRWLPCLSWQQAPTAPSGCHWRAAPLLLFFCLLKKKRSLIWREKCPATFPMHSSGCHSPCLRQQWGAGMSGME